MTRGLSPHYGIHGDGHLVSKYQWIIDDYSRCLRITMMVSNRTICNPLWFSSIFQIPSGSNCLEILETSWPLDFSKGHWSSRLWKHLGGKCGKVHGLAPALGRRWHGRAIGPWGWREASRKCWFSWFLPAKMMMNDGWNMLKYVEIELSN